VGRDKPTQTDLSIVPKSSRGVDAAFDERDLGIEPYKDLCTACRGDAMPVLRQPAIRKMNLIRGIVETPVAHPGMLVVEASGLLQLLGNQ